MIAGTAFVAIAASSQLACSQGDTPVELVSVEPHDALVAEYVETTPIPTGPWKGIGDGSSKRASMVARERELLTDFKAEPTPALLRMLGILYTKVGETKRGIAFLAKSLEVDPGNTMGWTWLGANRLDHGDLEAGAVLLERAITIDPENALAIKFLGVARARSGDISGAKATFEEALRVDPNSADAMVELAALLEDEDETERAFQLLSEAFRIRPDDDATLFRLARLARELGKEDAARSFELRHERLRVLEDFGFLENEVSPARRSVTLGIYFLERGRSEEALAEFEFVLGEEAEAAVRQNALLGRARCLVELKRFEAAELALSTLREAHPEHVDLPTLDARLAELKALDQ